MSKKQGAETGSANTAVNPARQPGKGSSSAGKGGKKEGGSSSRPSGEGGFAAKIAAFRDYLVLSRAELRKVSWPTWKETRATALVVMGFVTIMAILLGLVDLVLSSAIRFILS